MTPRPSVRPLCSVRACGEPLTRAPGAWSCPRGHSFDVARSGYVNLLQPGDRRSTAAGDSAHAVRARARLEQRGVGEELRSELVGLARSLGLPVGAPVLDVGAGSGALLERLRAELGVEGWAVDLSAAAAQHGARRFPELDWVVANADRRLPFPSGAFALIVSCVGPKNPAEFRRVLAPGGSLLVAVPAPDDLLELRRALLGRGELVDRTPAALDQFGSDFESVGRSRASARLRLERSEIEDLLAASYRGARHRERARLDTLQALETTLAADVLHFVPR